MNEYLLLVEDHYEQLQPMQEYFEYKGYSCQTAHTETLAWELILEHNFTGFVIDVNLSEKEGGIEGITLALKIRARSKAPIIFITAFNTEEHAEKAQIRNSRFLRKGGTTFKTIELHLNQLWQSLAEEEEVSFANILLPTEGAKIHLSEKDIVLICTASYLQEISNNPQILGDKEAKNVEETYLINKKGKVFRTARRLSDLWKLFDASCKLLFEIHRSAYINALYVGEYTPDEVYLELEGNLDKKYFPKSEYLIKALTGKAFTGNMKYIIAARKKYSIQF